MDSIASHVFTLGVPVWEKIIRAAAVYVFLIAGLRLSGKRELAQLNPFDLVVLLTLANTVQNAIIGDDNSLLGGLIGASALLAINYLTVRFMFHHPQLERLVEGDAVPLIEKGKVDEDQLKRQFISRAELEAAARRQGFQSFKEVEEAILESGGTVSFLRHETTSEGARYREVLRRLDQISADLNALKRAT